MFQNFRAEEKYPVSHDPSQKEEPVKKFKYYSRDSHPKLTRRGSFCVLDGEIYFKGKDSFLGKGGYGSTFKFSSESGNIPPIIVKKENPYEKLVYASSDFMLNNARFARIIMGDGAIAGDLYQQTRPRYVCMPFSEGDKLNKMSLADNLKRININIAILQATKKLHDEDIVHGDLFERNILIECNSNDEYIANLIDFDLTRKCGNPVPDIKYFEHDGYAPEMDFLKLKLPPPKAEPAQDIYTLGYIFDTRFESKSYIRDKFHTREKCIYNIMMSPDPEKRPDVETILFSLNEIKQEMQYEKLRKSPKTLFPPQNPDNPFFSTGNYGDWYTQYNPKCLYIFNPILFKQLVKENITLFQLEGETPVISLPISYKEAIQKNLENFPDTCKFYDLYCLHEDSVEFALKIPENKNNAGQLLDTIFQTFEFPKELADFVRNKMGWHPDLDKTTALQILFSGA